MHWSKVFYISDHVCIRRSAVYLNSSLHVPPVFFLDTQPSCGGRVPMDSMSESTGERLQNLCRRGEGSSTSEFERMKEAGNERMGGIVLHPEMHERNHQDAGSKEEMR